MEFIHIRVPKETRQRLKTLTASQGKSMTSVVGELIQKYLSENKKVA